MLLSHLDSKGRDVRQHLLLADVVHHLLVVPENQCLLLGHILLEAALDLHDHVCVHDDRGVSREPEVQAVLGVHQARHRLGQILVAKKARVLTYTCKIIS